jgi:hypothetical protein
MTKQQYEDNEERLNAQQRSIDSRIRRLADGPLYPPVTLADGDRLQMEAIEESERLTEEQVEAHNAYCDLEGI